MKNIVYTCDECFNESELSGGENSDKHFCEVCNEWFVILKPGFDNLHFCNITCLRSYFKKVLNTKKEG